MRFGKHRVTLCFNTPEQREWVIGQMTDGAMENMLDIDWDGGPRGPNASDAELLQVKPIGKYWEHHKKMRRKYGVLT